MRLATVWVDNKEQLAICRNNGWVLMGGLNRAFQSQWPESLGQLLKTGQLSKLNAWYQEAGSEALDQRGDLFFGAQPGIYAPLYRHPPKIWGIGLNYSAHAEDLSESAPTAAPASFMKPDTTIIGPGDEIRIPILSEKTTAEAELGIIIGNRCKDVPREKWLNVVAGFTTVLDMTAEDILRQNPRYLTMSKSFDTFFSFGPQLVTPDEVDDVLRLKVSTVINGRVHAENTVDHMTFPPDELIAYHSTVMTLLPGDIISTGTPGAVHIRHGDQMACRISGFESLHNPVVDLKQS
ncbi:MAG: fumarylacetoacetate hydrolase family protein [Deltaproteobacteria bacterium]|nr:fumarylacetoacetate hydrolase family protein [Deltaproteobacteria bacterium]